MDILYIIIGIVVLGFLLVLAVAQTIGFFHCAHTIIQDIIDYFGRSRKNK